MSKRRRYSKTYYPKKQIIIFIIAIMIAIAGKIRQGIVNLNPTSAASVSMQTASGEELAIKPYEGAPSIEINGNIPFFSYQDKTETAFEDYSDLDIFGRCGTAYACLGPETMPTEARGQIGSVKPTGWHTVKYAGVSGNYL